MIVWTEERGRCWRRGDSSSRTLARALVYSQVQEKKSLELDCRREFPGCVSVEDKERRAGKDVLGLQYGFVCSTRTDGLVPGATDREEDKGRGAADVRKIESGVRWIGRERFLGKE